jgi:hypothetical protein
MTEVVFVSAPNKLSSPPTTGRLALVDVAFAFGKDFDSVTRPWLALGDRLALWVDHHDQDAWKEHRTDARFLLVPRKDAPACPQLITPELVARAGHVDTLSSLTLTSTGS